MSSNTVSIDDATILDNVDDRQVEFTGEAGGEPYPFALRYEVLEALAGRIPDDEAVALFRRFPDEIGHAAARALARDPDQQLVVVSGNDLA